MYKLLYCILNHLLTITSSTGYFFLIRTMLLHQDRCIQVSKCLRSFSILFFVNLHNVASLLINLSIQDILSSLLHKGLYIFTVALVTAAASIPYRVEHPNTRIFKLNFKFYFKWSTPFYWSRCCAFGSWL